MKVLIILFLCCFTFQLKAQTFNEFFRQKKTQKEYLLKQIAALKVYGNYLKEGYGIAQNGWKTIADLRSGEFGLHLDFFNSLKAINPLIASHPQVKQIIENAKSISMLFSNLERNNLTQSEWNYVSTTENNLLRACQQDLEVLQLVLSKEKLEMKDDERMSRISSIHKNMQDRLDFTTAFFADVKTFQDQKSLGIREIKLNLEMVQPKKMNYETFNHHRVLSWFYVQK